MVGTVFASSSCWWFGFPISLVQSLQCNIGVKLRDCVQYRRNGTGSFLMLETCAEISEVGFLLREYS